MPRDSESRDTSEEQKRDNPRELALALLAFTVCFYGWSILGPLGPEIQDKLHLSDTQLAITLAVPVLLGSLMRVPFGIWTARYGGRRVFTVLMAFTVLPLLGLAGFHSSWAAVLVFGFLLGFAGASFAVGVPFTNAWYRPARQGFALGVYGMGMGGTVLAALTAARIAKATSLTVPFLVAAALLAVTAVIFGLLAHDAPGSRSDRGGSMLAPLGVFKREGAARAWALTLFYFMAFGGFVAMFLYLPKLLHGVHHLSKTDASTRAAGFAVLAVLARPVGGWAADRIGAKTVLAGSFIGTAALAVVLALTYEQMVPLTICCLTMAVCLGLGTGAVFKLVPLWFPTDVGAVTGVVGAAGGLGGFFPPLVMAVVKSQTGSYALGFVLMGAVALVALAVLMAIERPRRTSPGLHRQPAVS